MKHFTVSQAAKHDLKLIAAYSQKHWGAKQRRIYLKNLDSAFYFLANNPLAGTPCPYILEGLRKHRVESHLIFYQPLGSTILIVRVLHKSMDVEQSF